MEITYQSILKAAQQLDENDRAKLVKALLETIGHKKAQTLLGNSKKTMQTTEEMMDFIQKDNIF